MNGKKLLSILAVLMATCCAQAQENLGPYIAGWGGHPICGINPNFPDPPPKPVGMPADATLPPSIPFLVCKSIAIGFSVPASDPSNSGRDALVKMLGSFGHANWEERMKPLNSLVLKCKPPQPVGLGPMNPTQEWKDLPVCNVSIIREAWTPYSNLAEVRGFKRFAAAIEALNLNTNEARNKLIQARAILVASGDKMTFAELADQLQ